jgi:hypothetical protein
MPVIPYTWRLRQEDCEFEASLGPIVRPSLSKKIIIITISVPVANTCNPSYLGG